jgi:hypothetical protein
MLEMNYGLSLLTPPESEICRYQDRIFAHGRAKNGVFIFHWL